MKAARTSFAFLAATAGAMLATFVQATPAQAATAYVKATGSDSFNCLDELNACASLDKGITASGSPAR